MKVIISICLLLFVLVTFSQVNYGQDEVIRVDTNLVTIPATVLDREGRYITNLKKEDFQIFENGDEQDVEFFESVEQPFTILFLVDTSGSMDSQMIILARAANSFLSQLPANDKIIVAPFDNWVDTSNKISSVKDLREKKIRLRSTGLTPTVVYDAVDYALKKMKKLSGRKAIVLFSDGVGSGYSASAKSNLRDAEENEASIYTVQFNTYPKVAPPLVNDKKQYYKKIETADKYVRDLAQITGGRHYQIDDIANLEETFAQVAKELGQQYSIGYYPKQSSKQGERRQIKVKVNLPNLAVRARDSYVVGNSKK